MSTPDASSRPAQVTVAGWSVAVASTLLVLSTFDALGSLHTVETRDQLTQAIDSGNLKGLGITLSEALTAKRWALYVSAVAAVVTGILGFFTLKRDKVARIGVTVAAVPIALAVPITGSFLAMLVAAGTVVLWSRPARDWFAGRPITQREPRPLLRRDDTPPPTQGPPAPWVPPTAAPPTAPPEAASGSVENQPAPTHGWGGAPTTWDATPPQPGPYAAYPPTPAALSRPRQVRNACVVTWVFSGFTALIYLVMLVVISVEQQALIDLVTENPAWDTSFDEDLIVPAAVISSIAFLIWCAAVAVVAVFTWRGVQWAWIVHLVSTGMAALIALVVLPASVIHLAAIGSVLGLLLSRPSRTWFTRTRR